MSKDKGKEAVGLSEIGLGLEEFIRRGARRVIQEAIEVELDPADRSPALHRLTNRMAQKI